MVKVCFIIRLIRVVKMFNDSKNLFPKSVATSTVTLAMLLYYNKVVVTEGLAVARVSPQSPLQ